MNIKKKLIPLSRCRAGSLSTLSALALVTSVLTTGCTPMVLNSSDDCALGGNQNADVVLDQALAGLAAGCGEVHYNNYFSRLLEVSKTAPTEPDRSGRIFELVNAAENKGVITHQGKLETINSYFNVKFIAAKSKNTIFSKGCDNKARFFRELDAELRLKKVGLEQINQDVAGYNTAKALRDNLKGTFEAACHASKS